MIMGRAAVLPGQPGQNGHALTSAWGRLAGDFHWQAC